MDTALVLGANGFLGAHLIGRLTSDPLVETVWAMVRPTEEETAQERLQRTFDRYEITVDSSKIRIVEGTPTAFRFGLDKVSYFELAAAVGQIFNCASSTDYRQFHRLHRELRRTA
ncbi:MAG: SDR family oxidoreductase [Rhodococcus sp. (in: high G+C Gram-positive bacteria)]